MNSFSPKLFCGAKGFILWIMKNISVVFFWPWSIAKINHFNSDLITQTYIENIPLLPYEDP